MLIYQCNMYLKFHLMKFSLKALLRDITSYFKSSRNHRTDVRDAETCASHSSILLFLSINT